MTYTFLMKSIFTLILLSFLGLPGYAHVALLAPKGGDTLVAGEEILIRWQEIIIHDTQNWDVLYSPDGGQNWDTVAADIDVSLLSYNWTVPDIPTSQGRIQIIQDNSGTDYNDISGDFTILSNTSNIRHAYESPFFIYPNPTTESLTITGSDSGNIRIFNAAGAYIQDLKITGSNMGIALTGYAKGVYYLLVTDSEKSQVYKVIKI